MIKKIFIISLKLRWYLVFAIFVVGLSTAGYIFYQADQFEKQHKDTWSKLISESQVQSASTTAPSPISTLVPLKIVPTKIETDPIVTCSIHTNCGGGTKQLKQSVCNQSVCCELKSGWTFYESKSKCTTDQSAQNNNTANGSIGYAPVWTPKPTQPPCTVYYPATKSYYTYTTFTPAECEIERSKYGTSIKTPTPTVDPALIKAHEEACNQIKVEWNAYKENFYATQYNNYNSSAEAVFALNEERNKWQNEANTAGCNIYLSI